MKKFKVSVEVKMYNNINILSKALDASWKRNEVISNNIANAETPGFKKSEVIFEDILRNQLTKNVLKGTTTNSKHIHINNGNIKNLSYKIQTQDDFRTRLDGNNVDIDVEMAEKAKNEILYNTLTSRIQSKFQKIKFVINEGR